MFQNMPRSGGTEVPIPGLPTARRCELNGGLSMDGDGRRKRCKICDETTYAS